MVEQTQSGEQAPCSCCTTQLFLGIAGVFIALALLKKFFGGGVNNKRRDLSNQVAVITGANTGIGIETAKDLAKNGAKVILACRDEKRGKDATALVNEVRANSAEFMKLDLSDLSSVRLFVNEFKSKYNKLDILINNAGIMHIPTLQLTKDGFESQIGTNHFGHFLLTNLLLDSLKASPEFRVINVSSMAHSHGSIALDDLHYQKRSYNRITAYAQSKIANILFTKGLQKRIDEQKLNGVTVSLHPGAVQTELMRHYGGLLAFVKNLFTPIIMLTFKTPLQGAQTTLYCAHEDIDKLSKGSYYSDCCVKKTQNSQITEENAEKLWNISTKSVKL